MSTPEQTMDEQAAASTTAPATGMARHYARYSGATVLMMAASLVSFPILTRLLDNTQFGILGYYDTWLMMAVTVIKLGGQHAILRMYPFGGGAMRMTHFTTNLVVLPMLVSVAVWLLALAAIGVADAWTGRHMPGVFWLALMLVPMMVFTSQIEMVLRVSERSGLLTASRVSWRWMELALVVVAVVAVQRSALSVYMGKIAAALILCGFYLRWVRRHLTFSRRTLDPGAYRESLRYGLPLVANEIAAASLISIDRIMLRHLGGEYALVGVFTIGCALAMQVGMLMSDPLWGAFNPIANRVHGTDGAQEVRALKRRVLLLVTYASLGIGVAIWTVGADVLVMLTGPDKRASGPVFAWLGTMFAFLPLLDVSGYGLLLHKRSLTVLALTAVAAGLNIGLNLLWIPTHGVMGAVYATVASYGLLSVGRCVLCPRELLQWPDRRSLLLATGAAAVFLLAVQGSDLFGLQLPMTRVLAAGGLWALCYLGPVLALDRRLWRSVFPGLARS